jgi:hypothetical protein
MALIDDVRLALGRLAPRGWKNLMQLHGLRLDAADLAAELQRPLVNTTGRSTIDRTIAGFEDFSPEGTAAIEPADPGRSLLYHALASPNVNPSETGSRADSDYPTLAELDLIENYIYSVAKRKLKDLGNVVVAVFAYQYRNGSTSVHGRHADMAFSRTGISRVGTVPMHYDPLRRSFWGVPTGSTPGIAVMPARYGAFLAERRKLSAQEAVTHPLAGPIPGDKTNVFLIPVHKLFSGNECLVGESIQQSFQEFHRSEKLRRIHQLPSSKGGVPPTPGFNINQPPFVRESDELVTLQPVGASVLLISNPRNALVETATQMNTVSGKREILRFRVPSATEDNRFFTSFQILASRAGRAAPEYAHIRFHVRPNGQLFDLNLLDTKTYNTVLKKARFQGVPGVEDGPLEAAHLLDHSCEGAISAQVNLSKSLKKYSGVSFVAAPDFLPLVGQIDVQRWAERNGLTGNAYFSQGGPEPLCYGRGLFPNPALPDPFTTSAAAFDRTDPANATIVALLSPASRGQTAVTTVKSNLATSWLTDVAADVFEPGWDTSMFTDSQGEFYVNYGLGSPFPEDAKLCAALNSFWPAAAPDAGRTFGRMTAVPLLDDEIGLHPDHPKVRAGAASSIPGWDGEFGPFFSADGKTLNFASIERSDYSSAAFHGKMNLGLLGRIETQEQLARMDAFRECADRIRKSTPMTSFDTLLVTAEKVADWSQRPDRFDPSLTGSGYLYVFADFGNEQEDPADVRRVVANVTNTFTCQVSLQVVAIKKNTSPPKISPWLHP